MRNPTRARAGFTLIELLVVVVIIGILATIATKGYQSAMDKARDSGMMSNTRTVQLAIENWKTDHSSLPSQMLGNDNTQAVGPLPGKQAGFPVAYLPGNQLPEGPWSNKSQSSNGDWGNFLSSNVDETQGTGSDSSGGSDALAYSVFGPSGIVTQKNGLFSDGGESQYGAQGHAVSPPNSRGDYGYIYFLGDLHATKYAVFGVGKAGNKDNQAFVVAVKANF
ncbi:MAG TPA: type II secretion system protein [Oscillatoriaceae cyanobacterium]